MTANRMASVEASRCRSTPRGLLLIVVTQGRLEAPQLPVNGKDSYRQGRNPGRARSMVLGGAGDPGCGGLIQPMAHPSVRADPDRVASDASVEPQYSSRPHRSPLEKLLADPRDALPS